METLFNRPLQAQLFIRTVFGGRTMARLSLFALALLVPLLIAKGGRDLKLFATQPLALIGLAAAVSAWLMSRDRPHHPAILLPLLMWLAALAASWSNSNSPAALEELVRQVLFLAIAAAACLACRRPDMDRLFAIWLFTFACVGGYALAQRLGYDPIEEFRRWHSQIRVFSTFGNPSFLGTHTAFLLPLWIGLAVSSSSRTGRQIWGACAAMTALILYWTFSRGAWLGAAAGTAAVLICASSWQEVRGTIAKLPKAVIILAFTLVLAVFVAVIPREHLTRRTDRLMLWQGTLSMIKMKPLTGWGLGAFPAEYPSFAPPAFAERMRADNTFAEHPHCEYLHVAVESGIAGLGLFIWLLTCIIKQAAQWGRAGDRRAVAVLGALVAVLTHIAVDRNFRLASTAAPFWLLAGVLCSRPREQSAPLSIHPDSRTRSADDLSSSHIPALATIASLTLGLALAVWTLRPLHASYRVAAEEDFLEIAAELSSAQLEAQRPSRRHDPAFHMDLGNAYAKEGNFPKAVSAFQEALRLDPEMTAAANNLGNSQFMMSQFDKAIEAYRRVLALNPRHQDARFNMAFAYFHQRKIKEALAECETLLRQDPQNPKALQLKQQLSP